MLLLSSVLLTATVQIPKANRGSPPNIILILADDLEMHPTILGHMPKLQELMVAGGMSFQNALVPISLCCPSRVSIFTGQHAHNHDIVKNTPPNGGFAKVIQQNVEARMFAPLLQNAGYYTALMGKYMNGYPLATDNTYVPSGWDEWYVSKGGVGYFNFNLIENGVPVRYREDEADYLTDVLTRKAVDFITQQAVSPANSPFFLELSIYAPHGPATPAPRHAILFPDLQAPRGPSFNEADISDKPSRLQFPELTEAEIQEIDTFYRDRVRSMQAVDDMIGELFSALAATGELSNTYLIFTSDNGYHQGEHRIAKGKQSPYEESEKVPFVVVGPGVPAGTARMEPISLIDLAPTFLDLAGLPMAAADAMDGRSLKPLLQSPEKIPSWRTAVLFEKVGSAEDPIDINTLSLADRVAPDDEDSEVQVQIVVAPGIVQEAKLPRFEGLHTDRYSYIRYGDGVIEFYDLWADPFQLNNLAESAPTELLAVFETQLPAMAACQGATCRAADTFSLPTQPAITATPTGTGLPTATRLPTGTTQPTVTVTATPTATPTATSLLATPTATPTATSLLATPTATPTSIKMIESPTATVSGLATVEATPTVINEQSDQLYLPLIVR